MIAGAGSSGGGSTQPKQLQGWWRGTAGGRGACNQRGGELQGLYLRCRMQGSWEWAGRRPPASSQQRRSLRRLPLCPSTLSPTTRRCSREGASAGSDGGRTAATASVRAQMMAEGKCAKEGGSGQIYYLPSAIPHGRRTEVNNTPTKTFHYSWKRAASCPHMISSSLPTRRIAKARQLLYCEHPLPAVHVRSTSRHASLAVPSLAASALALSLPQVQCRVCLAFRRLGLFLHLFSPSSRLLAPSRPTEGGGRGRLRAPR